MKSSRLLLFVLAGFAWSSAVGAPPRLKVSDNHHFLVTESGAPFFWLGDTAWEIFHRLTREEADRYLKNRADKGFTVIQAVALAEFDGLHEPNAYGHKPLIDDDPTRPDVQDGPANDYWDHVDYVVKMASELGLTVGFLPTWGDKWNKGSGAGPQIFTPANAAIYGEWIGRRYKDAGLVWILGGDRGFDNDEQKEVMRAMARGLRKGDGGTHLISLHPNGGAGSAGTFHNEPWLDFNMRQNGHDLEFTGRYDRTREDYNLMPPKPILDAEPICEDHPVSFNAKKFGHSVAADVRRAAYWDLFGGAFGHTYGHHSMRQFFDAAKRDGVNSPLMPWTEAMEQPGAAQMQHARHLLESRPFLTRVPDDAVIVETEIPTAMPGAGTRHFAATRDESGSYAMVYAPVGRAFKVRMDKITGAKVKAWWFNPRDGSATAIGEFPNTGERKFTPPNPGEAMDWVLVLDDAAKSFPAPGARE